MCALISVPGMPRPTRLGRVGCTGDNAWSPARHAEGPGGSTAGIRRNAHPNLPGASRRSPVGAPRSSDGAAFRSIQRPTKARAPTPGRGGRPPRLSRTRSRSTTPRDAGGTALRPSDVPNGTPSCPSRRVPATHERPRVTGRCARPRRPQARGASGTSGPSRRW
jgi:hypothetical protein